MEFPERLMSIFERRESFEMKFGLTFDVVATRRLAAPLVPLVRTSYVPLPL